MNKKSKSPENARVRSVTPSVQKKIIPVALKSPEEEIALVAAGDFHVGATCFNETAFYEFVRQILEESKKRHVYVILMGDLFDAINITDKRFQLAEHKCSMDDAQIFIATSLKPLLESKRVHFVGALIGNHELKYCRGDSDPIYRLYRETGVEPLGIKAYIYFDLFVGKKKIATLRTVAFHGASNSRLEQGRVRIVRDFLRENELTEDDFVRLNQIAFYGHTHDCRVEEVRRIVPVPREGIQARYTQYTCLTGSFYDIANFNTRSYVAERGLSPTPVGYIKAIVSLNKELKVEAVTNNGLNPDVVSRSWRDM